MVPGTTEKRGGRTRGTRKGSGTGWGGPKTGEGAHATLTPFTSDNQPGPEAVSAGRRAAIADMQEIKEFYTERMRDPNEGTGNRIAAADKLADRIEGKAIARNVNADADNPGAIEVIRRVIVDPNDPDA